MRTKNKKSFNIADYYEMNYRGGGGVDKQKDIITQKIGLDESNADYIISMSPKIAVWIADSIVKEETKDLKKSIQDAEQFISEKTSERDIKQRVLQNINNRYNYIRLNYGNAIRLIVDWISHPLTPKQNLRELSFAEAVDKANIFHEELKVLGGDVDFVEPEENYILKKYPKDKDNIEFYWVYIPSNFCNIESSRMGHCGRTGYGNSLLSLRSIKPYGKGHTINDSHVTIAYNVNEGLFYQTKGKKNQKPNDKYKPYIFDLIREMSIGKGIKYATFDMDFNGFGSEYDSKEDYGFEDMTKEQVRELYELRPDIFNSADGLFTLLNSDAISIEEAKEIVKDNEKDFVGFKNQLALYNADIIDTKPSTTIVIVEKAKYVSDLLRVDRDLGKKIIENILEGDTYDIYDNFYYYYKDGGYENIINDLDDENEQRFIDEIVRLTGLEKYIVEENGVEYYLTGQDDEFDKDLFDNLIRVLCQAQNDADRDDYSDYLYKELKDSLEELGDVEYLNDEGIKITIDMNNFFSDEEIAEKMEYYEFDDIYDLFYEAIRNDDIELPRFSISDYYHPSPSIKDFNSFVSDMSLEDGYENGGDIKSKFYYSIGGL